VSTARSSGVPVGPVDPADPAYRQPPPVADPAVAGGTVTEPPYAGDPAHQVVTSTVEPDAATGEPVRTTTTRAPAQPVAATTPTGTVKTGPRHRGSSATWQQRRVTWQHRSSRSALFIMLAGLACLVIALIWWLGTLLWIQNPYIDVPVVSEVNFLVHYYMRPILLFAVGWVLLAAGAVAAWFSGAK
jgi:hypothetical protein